MIYYDLLEKNLKLLSSLKCWLKKEKEEKIKCFRIDHGGELSYDDFKRFFDTHRIKRQLTAPYTPQHNGIVERKKRTIMSLVRNMLKEKELPLEFRGEAVSTCVYVSIRSSTKRLASPAPYEK